MMLAYYETSCVPVAVRSVVTTVTLTATSSTPLTSSNVTSIASETSVAAKLSLVNCTATPVITQL